MKFREPFCHPCLCLFACTHLLCFNRLFLVAALSCPLNGLESSSMCLKILMKVDIVILLQQQLSATTEWRSDQTAKLQLQNQA